uniref:Glycosyltransferase n=1 Tax=Fagopyrum tataricum TaxID=62330 RepID=A0A385L2X0_FAGTA|nr:UFGT40 [Fagopyrum tataricum]QAV53738.1 UGT73E11 [Fagopyrum tataricum]
MQKRVFQRDVSMEMLPSKELLNNLLAAMSLLQEPLEQKFSNLDPPISCIVSDKSAVWTSDTASKFHIPRIVFDGTSCFSLLTTHNILASKIHETVSDSKPFVVPGLPDHIVLTRSQLPNAIVGTNIADFHKKERDAELSAYGVVVNTLEELEPSYVKELKRVRGERVWCVGPVSICNKDKSDKSERGNRTSIELDACLKWLDSKNPSSVVYCCLGSMSTLQPVQLKELGFGMEESNRSFVWVIRGGKISNEMDKWFTESGFEERTKDRGLIIRGWAPQMLILSHKAVGGFVTHCGWNSTLEGICAGLPLITWPLFAEQFYNEKFIVHVLGIGVSVGAGSSVKWGKEEEFGVMVKKEAVMEAIDEVMGGGEEGEKRRRRVAELSEAASKALEEGGSSFLNMELLINDIQEFVSQHGVVD